MPLHINQTKQTFNNQLMFHKLESLIFFLFRVLTPTTAHESLSFLCTLHPKFLLGVQNHRFYYMCFKAKSTKMLLIIRKLHQQPSSFLLVCSLVCVVFLSFAVIPGSALSSFFSPPALLNGPDLCVLSTSDVTPESLWTLFLCPLCYVGVCICFAAVLT